MAQVHFTAPTHSADLRVVMSAPTIRENDHFGIAYRTHYGETCFIYWLTEAEAIRRANAMRKRGYRVVSGPMETYEG